MSADELIEVLADNLAGRDRQRKREEMPAITLEAQDGMKLVVTLERHHREGCLR